MCMNFLGIFLVFFWYLLGILNNILYICIMKTLITIILTVFTLLSYSQDYNKESLDIINEYRIENGLSPLEWDDKAYKLCDAHSKYMAENGVVNHDGFDERASKLPWGEDGISENAGAMVIFDFDVPPGVTVTITIKKSNPNNPDHDMDMVLSKSVPEKAIYCWKRSPPHNENLLAAGSFGAVAIVYSSSDDTYYKTFMIY